jgi:hypothetical protein
VPIDVGPIPVALTEKLDLHYREPVVLSPELLT